MRAGSLGKAAFRATPLAALVFLSGAVLLAPAFPVGDPPGRPAAAGRVVAPPPGPFGGSPAAGLPPLPIPARVPAPPPDVAPLPLELRVLVLGPEEGEEEARHPAGGATVTVRSASGILASAVTDPAGLAAFSDLPDVDLVLDARRSGEAGIGRVERQRGERTSVVRLDPEAWITGLVVDGRDGAPLDAVEVDIVDPYGPEKGRFAGAVVVPAEGGPSPPFRAVLASGRTSSDGRFRVSLAREWVGPGVLVARAPAYAPGATVDLFPEEEILLSLDPAGSARGRVLGPGGDPVAGAEVLALRGESELSARGEAWWSGDSEPLVQRTLSGPDGEWVLDGLPSGRALRFLAVKEGLGRSLPVDDAWVPFPGAEAALDLRIRRHPRLVVRVEGVVLREGAVLEVEAIAPDGREPLRLAPLPGEGPSAYVLDSVPPGPLLVHAVSSIYHPT